MPKTFYIIDGHAQIYRAYFAPFRDLSSPSGEPTKATFVFTQWLMNLVENRKPDYLAMVIDSGDESVFRKEIFPEYKANRQPPPDDFFPQEQRILQIVRDAGVPIFAKPGYEADDIIATMTRQLCNRGYQTYIVSKDKDLRQLIDDCTLMYDMQADTVMDAAAMQEKCGYPPSKAIEVQTLMGDAIDNVQGIPGVGEKTAAKLINTYGSVEGLYQHLAELTPKLRENAEKFADRMPISRKLVTLKNDVDIEFDPAFCEFKGLKTDALKSHLESLGFNSLARRVRSDGTGGAAANGAAGASGGANPGGSAPGNGNDRGNASSGNRIPAAVGATSVANPPRSGTYPRANRPAEMGLFGMMGGDPSVDPSTLPAIPVAQTCAGCNYHLVQTEAQFEEFLAELRKQPRFAFDTETDALGAMSSRLVGMSFSWQEKTGWYVPVLGPSDSQHLSLERALRDLRPILEDPAVKKIGHNIKYDIAVMRQAGVHVAGVELDTMLAAFLLDSSQLQYGIDRLALKELNIRKVPTTDLIGKGKMQLSMAKVDLDRIAAYAGEDADIAWRLGEHFGRQLAEITELKKLSDDIETPLIDVLVEMETNGIAIDRFILKEQSLVFGERIEELRKKIFAVAGIEFNIDSPKQLQDILFVRLKLPMGKKTKTGASTDVEVLEKLAAKHEVPRLILDYRSLVKLKNTYLDNLTDYVNPTTGRIHASFNQTGAATGRLSCSDPNLQNIPIRTEDGRRIRLAFVPGDPVHNVLLTADYSQIELRILAHFTQEPALLRAFANDEDIHRAVASEVFGVPLDQVTRAHRDQAKTINFGIIYGVSAFGLSRRIEGLSMKAAQELITAYNKRFPAIQKFLDQCVMEAQTEGYVKTITGRRRLLPEIHSHILAMRNGAERMAINSVVQGSAADLIKMAMNNIHKRIRKEGRPSRMLLQVHDELVFETPASEVEAEAAMVREEMNSAMKLTVPLKVEVGWGKNWQEVK